MRKVVTISLNGNAYQIEEGGFEALRGYLEGAQEKLRDDPDRPEILADLEQAIAEKCNRYLSDHKNVVGAGEVERILSEMGPVDGPAGAGGAAGEAGSRGQSGGQGEQAAAQGGAGAQSDAGAPAGAPKRLYQIREGAMISGVCKGIAAYFNVDVTIVRIIFVALAILTWGAWVLAYIVMMFVIPYASTSEEHAAAHGLPFNAQHLIDEAKKQYASFKDGTAWSREHRREARARRREWRREWRRGRRAMKEQMRWGVPPQAFENAGYAARVLMGVMIPIAALCNAVLIVGLLLAIAQLVMKGNVFGWVPPDGIPLWAGVLILVIVYHVLAAPLRATRHAAYYAHGPNANAWFALWGSVLWLGFVAVFFAAAYHYWPDLQHFLQEIAESIRNHRVHAPGATAQSSVWGLWSLWSLWGLRSLST